MLEVGKRVSYASFGPGEVIEHRERLHQGVTTTFAVLDLPHQQMQVQIALDDPTAHERLREIVSAKVAKKLLERPSSPPVKFSAVYEERERASRRLLRENDPQAWANLLWSYAAYVAGGGLLAVSDRELISGSIGRLSCECGYALNRSADKLSAELWAHVEVAPRKRGRRPKAA